MDKHTDERTNKQTNGQTNAQMDKQTQKQTHLLLAATLLAEAATVFEAPEPFFSSKELAETLRMGGDPLLPAALRRA